MFFKTTEELRAFIAVDVNMKFSKIKPSIDEASEIFIKPLLGITFFGDLAEAYTAAPSPTELPEDVSVLLPYVQRALAYYAAFLAVEEIGVSVGDLGIQQSFNQNSQPAPAWKVNNLKVKYITSADRAADSLLEFLEDTASPTVYTPWYSDANVNTAMSGAIVHKTAIASRYIDINGSRRVFLRLKKRIHDIETGFVKRMLCATQYDELVAQLKANSLSETNQALVSYLEPIIAKKALYLTIPALSISIEGDGIMLLSSNDTAVMKQAASIQDKNLLMASLKDGDLGFEADEAELTSFIAKNIDNYPLIASSPCWSSKSAEAERWQTGNSPCNKHFSV